MSEKMGTTSIPSIFLALLVLRYNAMFDPQMANQTIFEGCTKGTYRTFHRFSSDMFVNVRFQSSRIVCSKRTKVADKLEFKFIGSIHINARPAVFNELIYVSCLKLRTMRTGMTLVCNLKHCIPIKTRI